MNAITQNFPEIQKQAGLPSVDTMSISQIIMVSIPYIYGVAGIILLINIATAGLKMMTSASDPKSMSASQSKITTSLVGILLLFASFYIVKIVLKFLGINFSTSFF